MQYREIYETKWKILYLVYVQCFVVVFLKEI